MDVHTREFQKLLSVNKMVNKMKENVVKSTMKLYRLKSSPYKLVRNKPVKDHEDVEMSNSCSQPPVQATMDERTELLQKLMYLTETVHTMSDYLIKCQMELYRQKSSPYKWTRDMTQK